MPENKENPSLKIMLRSAVLTLVSVLVLLFSFGKEAVIASFFGITADADVYSASVDLSTAMFSVLSVAISNVLVPMYSKRKQEEGIGAANAYASNLICITVICSTALLLVLELFASVMVQIAAPGMTAVSQALTVRVLRFIMPTTSLAVLAAINTSISNSHERYYLPALLSVFLNFPIILASIFLSESFGIYALVIGTLAGSVLSFCYSCLIRRKFYRFRPSFHLRDPYIIKTLRLSVPSIVGAAVNEVNSIVDKAFASMQPVGAIAAMNYGSKITSGIFNIVVVSLSTVSYTELSNAAAANSKERLARIFHSAVRIVILLVVPLIVGGILLSQEIISFVYQRGSFSMDDVRYTAPIFSAYLFALFFSGIQVVCTKYFYACQNTRTPVFATALCVGVNIPLNALFSHFWGAAGLALATACSTAVSVFFLLTKIKKQNGKVSVSSLLYLLLKTSVAALLMGLIVFILRNFLSTRFSVFWVLLCSVCVGACVYAAALLLLNVEEIRILFRKVWNMLRKGK